MAQPRPPIELTGTGQRLATHRVEVEHSLLERLRATGAEVVVDRPAVAEASRDWWPLAMHWALAGQVPALASVVVRPASTGQVAAVVQACHQARVPVTAAGGRSGVCAASVPVFGGVLLDTTAMQGIVAVDDHSLRIDVLPGTFGHELEAALRADHGLTLGHWPQSVELSTVGGWLACRSAGQYSTRYGKIEDMAAGLEVVLADGSVLAVGDGPRSASGPDLVQLFVGSEGTLGIITRATLRVHPAPPAERAAAYRFPSWEAGLDACRRIIRRGATPAVLRLYDAVESARGHDGDGTANVLLVLDEGDAPIVDATMSIVDHEVLATAGAAPADAGLVERWKAHRNDTSALQALTRRGFVVDTLEVAAPWSRLRGLRDRVCDALLGVPHARAASCHLSHSYPDGACLYFTFAATPPADELDRTYTGLWDAAKAVLATHGANLSHHHGVGLNQARFTRTFLGDGVHDALAAVKAALDPHGILNPGKLGLPSAFGAVPWP